MAKNLTFKISFIIFAHQFLHEWRDENEKSKEHKLKKVALYESRATVTNVCRNVNNQQMPV